MIDFPFFEIAEQTSAFGVPLTDDIRQHLTRYGDLLLSWNEKMHLTAITEPREILFKHFYDCLLFFKAVDLPIGSRLIDVGTGAGFPGLVLKIARPDLKITLLDSLNKRLLFLNEVISDLRLTGISTLHMRAEEAGQDPLYREAFDIACARAVAPLGKLSEYCLPFVKVGGDFIAMKGASAEQEITQAQNALRLLGGSEPTIICETLPGKEQRSFVRVKKISQTPTKYPRKPKETAKQPL